MRDTVDRYRFASYVFWAFLVFLVLSAIFAPDLWTWTDWESAERLNER